MSQGPTASSPSLFLLVCHPSSNPGKVRSPLAGKATHNRQPLGRDGVAWVRPPLVSANLIGEVRDRAGDLSRNKRHKLLIKKRWKKRKQWTKRKAKSVSGQDSSPSLSLAYPRNLLPSLFLFSGVSPVPDEPPSTLHFLIPLLDEPALLSLREGVSWDT